MLSVALLIMTAQLLLSCARVTIKDEIIYGDEGSQGAVYFNFLTATKGHLSKSEWDAKRLGMACISTDSLADWKAEIEKLCSYSDDCDYDTQEAIESFFAKLGKLKREDL